MVPLVFFESKTDAHMTRPAGEDKSIYITEFEQGRVKDSLMVKYPTLPDPVVVVCDPTVRTVL